MTDAGPGALVLAAHGSQLNPGSAEPVLDHADRIRDRGRFDEVRAAFWKEEPSLREVLRTLESRRVVVVPVTMSGGYFADEVFPRELGLASGDRDVDDRVRYAGPVGTHPAMTDVIVRRAESVTGDPDVGPGVGLAVVGHGTERNENSAASTREHAARIRERGRFDEVEALFMDEPPFVDDVTDYLGTDEVVVVPLFVADGYHTTEDIPADIGMVDGPGDAYDVPAVVDGRRIWYAGAVGTVPLVADVIVERAAEAAADWNDGRGVEDGPGTAGRRLATDPGVGGRAFLRWVDRADGDGRTWGQLAVTVRAVDGDRRYAVCHRDDRGTDPEDLDACTPREVRDRVRLDDEGRYRPLKGAPTLSTGWIAADLDGRDLVRTVEYVYPASIANWARERAGDLDVTHWRDAAARQTGLYTSVGELSGADLASAVAACCAGCAKRRAWDEDEGTRIDVDRGDGAFPCREPCAFFVAAAREFLALDEDAVAAEPDGSVRAGAFDRPGNRYRERYLAARRGRSSPEIDTT